MDIRIMHGNQFYGQRSGQGLWPMQDSVLRLLIKSSNFTYEMVHIQGKTAMDGGFRKRGHGCPLLPPRPDSKAFLHFISEICFLS